MHLPLRQILIDRCKIENTAHIDKILGGAPRPWRQHIGQSRLINPVPVHVIAPLVAQRSASLSTPAEGRSQRRRHQGVPEGQTMNFSIGRCGQEHFTGFRHPGRRLRRAGRRD